MAVKLNVPIVATAEDISEEGITVDPEFLSRNKMKTYDNKTGKDISHKFNIV